jgi:outer membrane murein-binding lipoprotein Lpp
VVAEDVSEIKRLEQLIHQNIGVTRGLSDKVQKLSEDLLAIEIHREHEKEMADRASTQIDKLTIAINSLNDTFATINGKAQGVSMMVKAFWALSGTIITASILWLSTTIVDLKMQVAVLQSKEK